MTTIVFSGSGSGIPSQAGVWARLRQFGLKFDRVGGTSGGGLLALAIASGKTPLQIWNILSSFLSRQDLLDLSLWPFERYGIYKGDQIYSLLTEVFEDRRMDQLVLPCRVTVCDLWARKTVVVDNSFENVLVRDVARCTLSIPIFFKAHRLRPNEATLYVDGGTAANFPLSIYGDNEPTIGVGFADFNDESIRPVRSLKDYAAALFDIRQDASNRSENPHAAKILIPSKFDRLKFGRSVKEIKQQWLEGSAAADAYLRQQTGI